MDVVVIFNGLGNQMSQYAFYLAKKKRNPKCIWIFDDYGKNNHNGYELGNIFGISYQRNLRSRFFSLLFRLRQKRLTSLLLRMFGVRVIQEDSHYLYDEQKLQKGPLGINFYWGGWPSEKHFLTISDEIRSTFEFPQQQDEEFNQWVHAIRTSENSISLHIRRGDYLIQTNDIYQFGGVANEAYFSKAIAYMQKSFPRYNIFVFSDDLEWCRSKFKGSQYHFVDCNRGNKSWRDMYLMSLCQHHINSNSTFSWWGAWLGRQEGAITLCPKEYLLHQNTPDVYPEKWVKII